MQMLISSRRTLPSFRPFRVEDSPQTSQQGQTNGTKEELSEENSIKLVYEVSMDICLCVCVLNTLFNVSWFGNWKNALQKFSEHEKSETHREATAKLAAKNSGQCIASLLNYQHGEETKFHRQMLLKLLSMCSIPGSSRSSIMGP